ncbi:hypothetical protein EMIHUDRAFT_457819 [Emiliania huxleyi CCMP1516]|uniref:NADP-dependent oxidoreductase domain-containing protein n=2 Tax=Emiliania huxleyi TaxID=2903 RepID=A0A0D3JL09_EMIH1|nr:hypothetical protein EMIHUDRAFT_457819 [Emiliania huxleyi CCMP1516]EOD24194.1 hypothetical protein EMIHUDRAFT_457819 [Emiliania huxleyi CCMP1516]|eukprot:XP_005776623.1 hypothetical protein EMIHUDRAFT_457819 [Emiliania huxleyi CCMP1516]
MMLASMTAKPVPSVEIAPSVLMPMLSFGITMQHSLFLALGGRGLDTAFDYGDKYQAELGRAVATSGLPRSAVFVTTKVPCCASSFVKDDVYSNHCHARRSPEETAADVAHDLSVLGMPFVDLLLMHWPCDSTADTVATWRVLERLALDGRARAIGVSNFNASAIESLLPHVKVRPAVNQCGFSVAGHSGIRYRNQTWGRDDATLAACRRHNITLMAYSPLGSAAPGGVPRVLSDTNVRAVAAAHNRTAAAVALRWLVQQGVPVVTQSDKKEHMVDDLEGVFSFELTDSEMARLAAIR